MLNRAGLTIVVHPNTDNPPDDHVERALWLGGNMDVPGELLPDTLDEHGNDAIVRNATPTRLP